ncbi:Magnesium transporter MRS2-F [Camellia lanceoleosa]|uniref:Magnesium transporter MRS2-F n=1 Tax=Camellia lanceoleosa TaxID=1840588 RepID=A0ACC0FND5_9ERIC|nr:Magnesium transporter MRS2-F [Camellia lanceoleosa]
MADLIELNRTSLPLPYQLQAKRKGSGVRTWFVVSKLGNSRIEELGKQAIILRSGVQEHIKAIITANEVLVPNPKDPFMGSFVCDLEFKLSDFGANMVSNKAMEQSPSNMPPEASDRSHKSPAEWSNRGNSKPLPFEFRAFEICLESVCRSIESETSTLEEEAYPTLNELSVKTSTHNLKHVRVIKGRLVALSRRVQKVRDEFEHVLHDDLDMAQMYLTDRLATLQSEGLEDELQNDANAFKSGNDSDEDMSSKSSNIDVSDLKPNVEELEMLLEAYFVQIEGILNKLSTLRKYIHNTEDYINIVLDDKQNQLLQMGTIITTGAMMLNSGVVASGFLSTNIDIPLFTSGTFVQWCGAAREERYFSIKENPDNGRDSVYWCVFVKTSCKRRPPVTLFTRGKAPITQQLPGESEKDCADFSSKILHLKKDIELMLFMILMELIDVEGDGMADMVFRYIQEMDINNRMMIKAWLYDNLGSRADYDAPGHHTLLVPIPNEELCESIKNEVNELDNSGSGNNPGECRKMEQGESMICKLHAANDIRRKRHFGEISSGPNSCLVSLVGGSNMDHHQYKESSQDFKRSNSTSEAAAPALVSQVQDVKQRLHQIEMEMSKLRTKQQVMKQPHELTNSGKESMRFYMQQKYVHFVLLQVYSSIKRKMWSQELYLSLISFHTMESALANPHEDIEKWDDKVIVEHSCNALAHTWAPDDATAAAGSKALRKVQYDERDKDGKELGLVDLYHKTHFSQKRQAWVHNEAEIRHH